MRRSPSTPSESFESHLLASISSEIYFWKDRKNFSNDIVATKILDYLRSKGVINNG